MQRAEQGKPLHNQAEAVLGKETASVKQPGYEADVEK